MNEQQVTLHELTAALDERLNSLAKAEQELTLTQSDADAAVADARKAYLLLKDEESVDITAVKDAERALRGSQEASENAQMLAFRYRRMLGDTARDLYEICRCCKGDEDALKLISEHLDDAKLGQTARSEFAEILALVKSEEDLAEMQMDLQKMLEQNGISAEKAPLAEKAQEAEADAPSDKSEKDEEQDRLIERSEKRDEIRDRILAAHTANDKELDRLISENTKRDEMRDKILAAHTANDKELDRLIRENTERDAERDSLLAKQIVKDVQLDRLIRENEQKDSLRDEQIAKQAAKHEELDQLLSENAQLDKERDNIIATHTASNIELRHMIDEQNAEIMELQEAIRTLSKQTNGKALPAIAIVLSVLAIALSCATYFFG